MKKAKKVLAVLLIILLVGLYISTLVFALMDSELSFQLLQISIFSTIAVPIILYVCNMLYKLLNKD